MNLHGCQPTVKLISATQYPIETVALEWMQSRTDDPIPTAEELLEMGCEDPRVAKETLDTFRRVVQMDLPVAETIDFIFLLENIPVSLREQIVRHRIGHRFDDRLGADVVPTRADTGSSFWCQSMRVKDMSTFVDDGAYYVPESVTRDPDHLTLYHAAIRGAAVAYRGLVDAGVPMEDARQVIPLCATHRMTWKLNLAALKLIFRKRSCWIAQLGMWEPIIRGMVDELCENIDPIFRRFIDPPCFRNGEWVGCAYVQENDARIARTDPGVPCSLYVHRQAPDRKEFVTNNLTDTELEQRQSMERSFETLWGRNPLTGHPL